MRKLHRAFSHLNLIAKNEKNQNKEWSKPRTLDEILKSHPKKVESYDQLVRDVAQILHRNRNLTLFYRGQSKDYKNNKGFSTILPSIYRKPQNVQKIMLKERFNELDHKVNKLRELFRVSQIKYTGTTMLNKYVEISWAILQHYEICETPLIDLTHSLHVACSFAFDNNNNKTGIIQILGMPFQSDAIGYNTYEELVNLRLLSVCPPTAQRPFFQEGYLAGPFPAYRLDDPSRREQFDFGRRIIAKFEIPLSDKFWGVGFNQIPHEKLYQSKDEIKKICDML